MIISHDCCISATEEMFPVVSNYLVSLVQNVPGSSPNDRKQKQKHLLFALKIVACWLTERSSRFQRVCCCFQAASRLLLLLLQSGSSLGAAWEQPGSRPASLLSPGGSCWTSTCSFCLFIHSFFFWNHLWTTDGAKSNFSKLLETSQGDRSNLRGNKEGPVFSDGSEVIHENVIFHSNYKDERWRTFGC